MKYKLKYILYFIAEFIFCMIYRFVIEGKSYKNSFYTIIDFTVNSSGYLCYIHTATFYTLIFVFILGKSIVRLNNQNIIRLSRNSINTRNIIISQLYSLIFSTVFCISHLLFLWLNYGLDALNDINFFKVFIVQLFALDLYYFLTSQIMMFLYYNTLSCIFSGLLTFIINAVMMFAYRILNLQTYIDCTNICTKYYTMGLSFQSILFSVLSLIPITIIFILINKIVIKNRDVL